MTDPAPSSTEPSNKDRLVAAAETLQAQTFEINDLLVSLLELKIAAQRSSNNWLIFWRTFLTTLVIGGLLASLIACVHLQGFRSGRGNAPASKVRERTSIIST